MNDAYPRSGGSSPDLGAHLPGWTLEQMAEDLLPPDEQRRAMLHVEACAQCAGELEGYRALFAALSGLPRFAPSPGFADAVIARTRLAPEPGPALAWLREFMPKSRRVWVMLSAAVVAPALPVLAAVFWLLTHPLISAGTLWGWVVMEGRAALRTAGAVVWQWTANAGLSGTAMSVYEMARDVPVAALTALVAVLAIAIPLSVWALVRLVRTPLRNVEYANRTV